MFKNWFSIGVLTLLTVLSKGDACSCMCGMSEQQLYPVTIMSYNVDTPEKTGMIGTFGVKIVWLTS